MSKINLYYQELLRRWRERKIRQLYQQSPKPLAQINKNYLTLFFDYEGNFSAAIDPDTQQKASVIGIKFIVDKLEQVGFNATFNTVGKLIETQYDMLARLSKNDYEIASHTIAHSSVLKWSRRQMQADMQQYRQMLSPLGVDIQGFRAPQSKWSFAVLQALLDCGLSWNAEADEAPWPYIIARKKDKILWRMPVRIDDWPMQGQQLPPAKMLEQWIAAVEKAISQRHYIAIGFHPWVLGLGQQRLQAFADFIDYLKNQQNIEIANFGQITRLLS